MTAPSRSAAQYVRMSSDKQDLSLVVQKEAIAAYAAARNIEVVATYEDDGRSGVRLANRPALLRLLRDVTDSPPFSAVLVYDVSRWGRFQDTDAAAYHEYHCKVHGVAVIYVAEMFGDEANPLAAAFKNMRRAMAAQTSRDLSVKCRAGQHQVVSRGYQMGPLPALGYRRTSVSADSRQQVPLADRQQKMTHTDRIKWVLASPEEVALVKRICDMYGRTRLSFTDIARLGEGEGWRDHQGRPMNHRAIATLVKNEALIGNFVWGRTKHATRIVDCAPSRHDGCIPRLVDDDTWAQIQHRLALEIGRKQTAKEIEAKLRRALQRSPLIVTRDFRAQGLPGKRTIHAHLGAWSECLIAAGQDPSELRRGIVDRARQRRENSREFGIAIAWKLREHGHRVSFDGRLSVLDFPQFRMRLRLLWPIPAEAGQVWRIRVEKISREVDFDLVVRMEERFQAKDFFVASPADVVVRFPQCLTEQIPAELDRFWCRSPELLLERIRTIDERS